MIGRIRNEGIADGRWVVIPPDMIRVSQHNYPYHPELIEYSVTEMARYFDDDSERRSYP